MSEILCTIDVCVEVHGAYEDNVLSWFAGSHRGLLRASVQLLIGIVFNINTVFNHGADKTTFNQEAPAADRTNFETSFRATLSSFGYSSDQAKTIAEILLPDVITYQVGSTADGAALNGRALADDVIDAELGIVTNGQIATDCVGPRLGRIAK